MEQQKFIEKIESIEIPHRYSMKISECIALIDSCYSKFETMMYAYNYGFKRGTNYGRKQTKCQEKKSKQQRAI